MGLLIAISNTSFSAVEFKSADTSKKNATKVTDVEIVTAKVAGTTYASRIKATHRLGGNISDSEIKELYTFLHKKPSDDVGINNLEFNGIKNEVVIALMNQSRYPADLTKQLAEMYQDKALGVTWRDYCIQFLSQWHAKMSTATEKELAVKTITAAWQEKDNGIAGTAVIAASKLVGKSDFKKEQVSAVAQALAEDKKVDHVTRIPALQVSAKLGNPQAIVTAREIVKSTANVPVMLKMSALAVLGMNGDSSDLDALKQYQNSSDVRLRAAAAAALHRLSKK